MERKRALSKVDNENLHYQNQLRIEYIAQVAQIQLQSNQYLANMYHRHSERKHIIRQLRQQVEAIKEKSVQNRFDFEYPYLVLSVFTGENLTAMRGILDELQSTEDWAIIEKFFLFAKLDDLINDFYGGLGYFGGSRKPVPNRI